jgi:hypothetical protein
MGVDEEPVELFVDNEVFRLVGFGALLDDRARSRRLAIGAAAVVLRVELESDILQAN